jgi:hypothetical protein
VNLFAWLKPGQSLGEQRDILREMSVEALCASRDEIAAELHRRAAMVERTQSHGTWFADPKVRSITVISDDREFVKIVPYRDDTDMLVASSEGRRRRFPAVGDRDRSFVYSVEVIPLAVYEGGVSAVEAWRAAERAENEARHEKYQREEYEKLKAKFG